MLLYFVFSSFFRVYSIVPLWSSSLSICMNKNKGKIEGTNNFRFKMPNLLLQKGRFHRGIKIQSTKESQWFMLGYHWAEFTMLENSFLVNSWGKIKEHFYPFHRRKNVMPFNLHLLLGNRSSHPGKPFSVFLRCKHEFWFLSCFPLATTMALC